MSLLAVLISACLAWAAPAAFAESAYVANASSHNVSVIDTATNAVVGAPIAVGDEPLGVAITPDGATAYVANQSSDDVTPIDTATNIPGTPIAVGDAPWAIAITPDGATAYVANAFSQDVTPIDTATNTAGTPIAVDGPGGIAITPDGATAYVTNNNFNDVTPIDTATNTAGTAIAVGVDPRGIAITPDGATAYVANFISDDVTPIDTATNTAGTPIAAGPSPQGIAITPEGATAYVTNFDPDTVTPIDTATNTAGTPIAVGASGPRAIAITPDGARAYVANGNSGNVSVIDTATNAVVGAPIAVGHRPAAVAITPAKKQPLFSLSLTPATAENPVGSPHTVTARLVDQEGNPVANAPLEFTVAGANSDSGTAITGPDGTATFTYTGTSPGEDTVSACYDADGDDACEATASAEKTWLALPKLSIDDVTVTEGNAGTTPATFTASLDEPGTAPVTVDYATADGSASAPADYESASGALTLAPGETAKTITVEVRGDTIDEPDERFSVELSNAEGAELADGEGVATITDDDRNGAFACRASAARIATSEPVVANPPRAPCRDDGDSLASLPAGPVSAGVLSAHTDQTPDDPATVPPAAGDNATADAELASATIAAGPLAIGVEALTSEARAECPGGGEPPELSGSSRLAVVVAGERIDVGSDAATIPLLLATLRVNQTIREPNRITQRALVLESPLLPEIVLGEATAGYGGNPCAT